MTPGPARDAPTCAELLAEFVAAVERGEAPSQAALEEAALALEQRADVRRVVRRMHALALHAELATANPGAPLNLIAKLVARRTGDRWETVRWWARGLDPTRQAPDDGERKERHAWPTRRTRHGRS